MGVDGMASNQNERTALRIGRIDEFLEDFCHS